MEGFFLQPFTISFTSATKTIPFHQYSISWSDHYYLFTFRYWNISSDFISTLNAKTPYIKHELSWFCMTCSSFYLEMSNSDLSIGLACYTVIPVYYISNSFPTPAHKRNVHRMPFHEKLLAFTHRLSRLKNFMHCTLVQ